MGNTYKNWVKKKTWKFGKQQLRNGWVNKKKNRNGKRIWRVNEKKKWKNRIVNEKQTFRYLLH